MLKNKYLLKTKQKIYNTTVFILNSIKHWTLF